MQCGCDYSDTTNDVHICATHKRVAELEAENKAIIGEAQHIAGYLRRVAELEAAALECHSQLSGMTMGTEGYTRNLICRASNVLAKVLGRTPSSHGSDEYFQNYKSQ